MPAFGIHGRHNDTFILVLIKKYGNKKLYAQKKKKRESTAKSIYLLIPADLCIKVEFFIFIGVTNGTTFFDCFLAIYRQSQITIWDSLQTGLAITHRDLE